jgi:hypothetical protein
VIVGREKGIYGPMSAEGPMPGTIADGEKAACSMSWK